MKRRGSQAMSARLYGRLWRVLVNFFRVPDEPPSPPARPGEPFKVFQPSEGYLRYQKFRFWVLLTLVDIPLVALWIWVLVAIWWLGLLLAPVFLIAIILPDLIAYVAIHLRYDTMWYALSERSMRIRHGIWMIQETTITFENVQNLSLQQGPLERHFGIARVAVQTAGGGAGGAGGAGGGSGGSGGHTGMIEGVSNAPEIRDLIMERVRHSQTAGMGDEPSRVPAGTWLWTEAHLDALRALRDRTPALGTE